MHMMSEFVPPFSKKKNTFISLGCDSIAAIGMMSQNKPNKSQHSTYETSQMEKAEPEELTPDPWHKSTYSQTKHTRFPKGLREIIFLTHMPES